MLLSFNKFAAFLLLASPQAIRGATDLCTGSCTTDDSGNKVCTFTTKIMYMAGELGYISFEECGEHPNPTLGLEVGTTYFFDQSDMTNHYHPLGFAYYPDGAHADEPELEPGIKPEDSATTCEDTMSCPAPMYMLGDEYLGVYSNNEMLVPVTSGEDDFGLDVYEPQFFFPLLDWLDKGEWKIALKFDVEDANQDMFYFCHIHQFMSGRIKVINSDGSLKQEEDMPELGYEYDMPSDFDEACGTFSTGQYQLPNSMCPEKFVCDVPDENEGLEAFSSCIEAMDCAMVNGMTNTVKSESEIALFIHQMIPHHQNAVNMAKALLNTGKLSGCEDITDDEDPLCVMQEIAYSIINTQNHQIQAMRGVLDGMGYFSEEEEACTIGVMEGHDHSDHSDHSSESDKSEEETSTTTTEETTTATVDESSTTTTEETTATAADDSSTTTTEETTATAADDSSTTTTEETTSTAADDSSTTTETSSSTGKRWLSEKIAFSDVTSTVVTYAMKALLF